MFRLAVAGTATRWLPVGANGQSEGHVTDYHINVFYSDEDGGYIADIPDLEHCSAFGATAEEAVAEVTKAKQAWIEAAHAAGKPVPRPRYRPAIYQTAK